MTKKLFLLILAVVTASATVRAQSDVVSLADALRIFQNPRQQFANDVLTKQGYRYKGVTTDFGKEYNWVRNMDLSKDGLPTSFGKGNSSYVLLSDDGKRLLIYVFNAACYKQLKQQADRLGYKAEKMGLQEDAVFYTKDDAPTLTFMQLEKPLPYCVQVTE